MIDTPHCAACGGNQWRRIDTRRYHRSERPGDDYGSVRHDVLFELWFTGENDVTLQSIACERCGFVCYSPRPTHADITSKYDYIARHERARTEFSMAKSTDLPRSRELYRYLQRSINGQNARILDYGGGNGRLLAAFLEAGHDCEVIDLVDETLPGITYAGSTTQAIGEQQAYDAVICSHVLEHLADPGEALASLLPLVKATGLVYIEVPSEIWKRSPPAIDPVTHINFFTTDSLRTLMQRSGLQVESCAYRTFIRPGGLIGLAIKAIGRPLRDGSEKHVELKGIGLTERLLNPDLRQRFSRLLSHPRLLKNLLP